MHLLYCLLIVYARYYFQKHKYYRVISDEKYEVVEGVCIAVMPKPLRKYRKIRIMDDNGNESSLLLGKQSKIKIGYRYHFYFKETDHISLGSEYFDSALSADCFLDYEELGEFAAEAFKRYAKLPEKDIALLSKYSKIFKVSDKVRSYLEVLL